MAKAKPNKAAGAKAKPSAAAKPAEKPKLKKSADQSGEEKVDLSFIGRPKKLVESDSLVAQIFGLARIGCRLYEAAAALFVSENTLRDFLRENERSRIAWESGPEYGKVSLRRKQFQVAMSGNTRMLTWLGIQQLDQRHKFDGRLSGADGGPIRSITTEMTAKEAADLYAQKLNGGP